MSTPDIRPPVELDGDRHWYDLPDDETELDGEPDPGCPAEPVHRRRRARRVSLALGILAVIS